MTTSPFAASHLIPFFVSFVSISPAYSLNHNPWSIRVHTSIFATLGVCLLLVVSVLGASRCFSRLNFEGHSAALCPY